MDGLDKTTARSVRQTACSRGWLRRWWGPGDNADDPKEGPGLAASTPRHGMGSLPEWRAVEDPGLYSCTFYRRRGAVMVVVPLLALGVGLAWGLLLLVRTFGAEPLRAPKSLPVQTEAPARTILRVQTEAPAPKAEPWRQLCSRHSPHPKIAQRPAPVPRPALAPRPSHPPHHDATPTLPLLRVLQPGQPVYSLAYSPGGRVLASGSGKLGDRDLAPETDTHEKLTLWNPRTGRRTRVFQHQAGAAMAYSPDGTLLATGDVHGLVVLRSVRTGKVVQHVKCSDGILFVAFSPDGRTLATGNTVPAHCGGSRPGEGILWETRTGRKEHTLKDDFICNVAFSPDGRTLASGDRGNTLTLWNPRTGQAKPRPMDCAHQQDGWEPCYSVAYSPDGRLLASSCGAVEIWDARNHRLKRALPDSDDVTTVVFSPDGTLVAGVGDDDVKLWSVRTGKLVLKLPATSQVDSTSTDRSNLDYIPPIAFSPDGSLLACGDDDGSIRLWRMRQGLATNKT